MSELEGLRDRVEMAVGRLSSSQESRRHQNRSLLGLLGNLEEKFNARAQELDYCNARIEALTRENAELTQLLGRLVGMVEQEPKEDGNDPLSSAAALAAGMVASWSSTPARDDVEAGSAPETPHEAPTAEAASDLEDVIDDPDALASAVEKLVGVSGMPADFEDVTQAELEAETRADDAEGLPAIVAEAAAAALDDLAPNVPIDDRQDDAEELLVLDSEDAALVADDEHEAIEEEAEAIEAEAEAIEEEAEAIAEEVDEEVELIDLIEETLDSEDDAPLAEAEEAASQEIIAAEPDLSEVPDTPAAADDSVDETALEDDGEVEPDDTEASIRAMMARLEKAAARAAASEEAADRPSDEEEAGAKPKGSDRAA